jgi:hypothetical protein
VAFCFVAFLAVVDFLLEAAFLAGAFLAVFFFWGVVFFSAMGQTLVQKT